MTHLRAVDVQNDLCASILSDYERHRAVVAAESQSSHQGRVAERMGMTLDEYAEAVTESRRRLAGPSPADRVAEFDARVIDLAERRGGRK